MVIRIEVVSCNGAPPTEPMATEFDEFGGSIGRAEDCALMLIDPERFISRVHASVECRAGQYVIVDRGKALPVAVNGHALGGGRESPIGDGDEIVIGTYKMRVSTIAEPARMAVDNKFQPPESGSANKDDPLALFGGSSPSPAPGPSLMDDPFALPKSPSTARTQSVDSLFGAPSAQPGGQACIPDDVDFGVGLPTTDRSVDDFFGLSPGAASEPFPLDSPLANRMGHPEDLRSQDPLLAFGGAAPMPAMAPQRDDAPELQASFKVPRAVHNDEAGQKAPPPDDAYFESTSSDRPPADATGSPRAQQLTDSQALFADSWNSGDSPGLQRNPEPPNIQSQSVLLAAFLQGAGVPDLKMPGDLTPETMKVLGGIFREAIQGTLDLLLARATIKREVRAEMTMIVGRENNPLKFSPNVETALTHLLAPQPRGFMSPADAIKDAYDDLRSHEFGFMAGMRAALASILQRFDPATLEHRLTQKSVVDSLLPMNRRAKLWDLFQSLYGEISKEAEDDFHTLFGREFVRAYQAQIEKLHKGDH